MSSSQSSHQPVALALSLAAASVAFVLSVALAQNTATQQGHSAGHAVSTPLALPTTAPAAARFPLSAQNATIVAVPPSITETSVFMTLRNTGSKPVVLSGVSSAVAAHGMLMVTRRDAQGRTGMSEARTLTVPAGRSLTLSATGDHLMLMGLKRPLKVGERLPLTLRTSDGRSLKIVAVVRKP
ncbi:copper chaperone PCu(A)C [Deinococcus sp. QL22]|uniref:copper chaperone PCu(A)C n=1 Tax=Deinococcus sp. QL22 TaxID=2939437 RepID=UPI0020179117|nr:copper chaperone PCu(A)C [Deinococcus sp. QL22]UQN06930.1 copper chaperone PCu(A)C [Deinococcus sp. QL22]